MWLEWIVVLALFPYPLGGTETVNIRVQLFWHTQGLVCLCSGTPTPNLLLWNPKCQCAIVLWPPKYQYAIALGSPVFHYSETPSVSGIVCHCSDPLMSVCLCFGTLSVSPIVLVLLVSVCHYSGTQIVTGTIFGGSQVSTCRYSGTPIVTGTLSGETQVSMCHCFGIPRSQCFIVLGPQL